MQQIMNIILLDNFQLIGQSYLDCSFCVDRRLCKIPNEIGEYAISTQKK